MATRFPSPTGPENHAAADPPRKTRAKPSGDGRGLRRTLLIPAAIVLIAAGAALLLIFSGSVAGVETDTVGVVAIALGAVGLMAQAAARRSRASSA
jgi:hypothetical protein